MDRQNTPVEFALSFVRSPTTRKQYSSRLQHFFNHIRILGKSLEEQGQAFLVKAKSTKNSDNEYWVEDSIRSFLEFQIERFRKGKLAATSIGSYYWPIKAFCEPYERELPSIGWKRLLKPVPAAKSYANDRAYQIEEIRKLVQHSDRRTKVLVYVMCSSGIRVGGWKGLCWKHVEAKKNDKEEVIAAKLTVYNEDGDQYYTFMTPEAYNALREYMDYRASYGENITGKSPLIRDRFATKGKKSDGGGDDNNGGGGAGRGGGRYGIATVAKPLSIEGIRKALNRELRAQGLRGLLPEGETRHEVKQAHGFRKFFYSRAIGAGMIHDNADYLMGHRQGNQASYFKPEEECALLQDYVKAVDALTINFDNHKATFQKQVAELKEKSKEESYFVIGKLAEKEREVENMKNNFEEMRTRQQAVEQLLKQFLISGGGSDLRIGGLNAGDEDKIKVVFDKNYEYYAVADKEEKDAEFAEFLENIMDNKSSFSEIQKLKRD